MPVPNSILRGKTILIVDDEVDLRQAIAYDFKRLGCVVLQASSGNEAYALFQETPVDIILSDVRMPDGTGVELLNKLRALHPTIPVILLITGFADISEPQARQQGANALLEKPIDRKLMISEVEKAFAPAA